MQEDRRVFYITNLPVAKFVVRSSVVEECNASMEIYGICRRQRRSTTRNTFGSATAVGT